MRKLLGHVAMWAVGVGMFLFIVPIIALICVMVFVAFRDADNIFSVITGAGLLLLSVGLILGWLLGEEWA